MFYEVCRADPTPHETTASTFRLGHSQIPAVPLQPPRWAPSVRTLLEGSCVPSQSDWITRRGCRRMISRTCWDPPCPPQLTNPWTLLPNCPAPRPPVNSNTWSSRGRSVPKRVPQPGPLCPQDWSLPPGSRTMVWMASLAYRQRPV
uniref:Uncharacterized protein n=1 Tax=Cacopsylla melanoneura TaxID=428564 RepID=A0A8D8WL37_9HEMI